MIADSIPPTPPLTNNNILLRLTTTTQVTPTNRPTLCGGGFRG